MCASILLAGCGQTPAAGPAGVEKIQRQGAGAVASAPAVALGAATPRPTTAARLGLAAGAGSAVSGTVTGGAAAETAAGTYTAKAVAGSREGDLRLELAKDGVAQMVTENGAGAAPIIEIGTWQSYSDGSVTVVLSSRIGGDSGEAPTTFVLTPKDGGYAATDFDAAVFGSEGPVFERQAAR
jgi:hypothetical protein